MTDFDKERAEFRELLAKIAETMRHVTGFTMAASAVHGPKAMMEILMLSSKIGHACEGKPLPVVLGAASTLMGMTADSMLEIIEDQESEDSDARESLYDMMKSASKGKNDEAN